MSSSVDMYPKVKYFHLQEETLSGYNSCYSVSQKQFLESGCKSGVQTSYLASDIRSEMAMGLKTIFYDVIEVILGTLSGHCRVLYSVENRPKIEYSI